MYSKIQSNIYVCSSEIYKAKTFKFHEVFKFGTLLYTFNVL